MGIWCENGVVSTSMGRHHVALALIRHFYVMCPLIRTGPLEAMDIPKKRKQQTQFYKSVKEQ